jgi:hypothetical protein
MSLTHINFYTLSVKKKVLMSTPEEVAEAERGSRQLDHRIVRLGGWLLPFYLSLVQVPKLENERELEEIKRGLNMLAVKRSERSERRPLRQTASGQ